MKKILLISEDSYLLDFLENNLKENSNYNIIKTNLISLNSYLNELPQLILIDVNNIQNITEILNNLNGMLINDRILLMIEETDQKIIDGSKIHFMIKPIRSKIVLSVIREKLEQKEANWLPAYH